MLFLHLAKHHNSEDWITRNQPSEHRKRLYLTLPAEYVQIILSPILVCPLHPLSQSDIPSYTLIEKRQSKSVHLHHLRNRDPRPTLLQNPTIGMTALVPINRPLGIKPISRRPGLLNSIVTSAAAAGRSSRPVAALARPLS